MPPAAHLLLVTLPLLVCGPSQAQSATPSRGPRIALEPARVDFGRVLQHKTLTRRILIRNLGDQDLLIQGVGSTCDCALGLTEGARIPPGRSAPLRILLRTGSSQSASSPVGTACSPTRASEASSWAGVFAERVSLAQESRSTSTTRSFGHTSVVSPRAGSAQHQSRGIANAI